MAGSRLHPSALSGTSASGHPGYDICMEERLGPREVISVSICIIRTFCYGRLIIPPRRTLPVIFDFVLVGFSSESLILWMGWAVFWLHRRAYSFSDRCFETHVEARCLSCRRARGYLSKVDFFSVVQSFRARLFIDRLFGRSTPMVDDELALSTVRASICCFFRLCSLLCLAM